MMRFLYSGYEPFKICARRWSLDFQKKLSCFNFLSFNTSRVQIGLQAFDFEYTATGPKIMKYKFAFQSSAINLEVSLIHYSTRKISNQGFIWR